MRKWIEPSDQTIAEGLLSLTRGSLLAARALARRGYADVRLARAFLDPDCFQPAEPGEMPGLDRAKLRLWTAMQNREHILVWGDFDVDGQTATAILVETLTELGGKVSYHIPIRAKESHGVGLNVLRELLEVSNDPPRLVLTCDTGISAYDAIAYANERDVDVIVTDHHELPTCHAGEDEIEAIQELLPLAYAIVSPRLLPQNHGLSGLPGAGVAYKLAEALYRHAGYPGGVSKYQDLAALGIVADVALLTGETRFLLQRGLECLRGSQRVGLQAIYEMSGLVPASMTEEQIGFVLAPRLNALGRLSDANPAVELLTTKDAGRARVLAMELEGWNSQRQLMTGQVLKAAQDQIGKDTDKTSSALVLASPSWPAGVIGIVASRLVDKYRIPAILISMPQGELARGSARSVEGVDITQALSNVSDLLSGFGGHAMAAGFSIDTKNIPQFVQRICQNIQSQKNENSLKDDSLLIEGFLDWGEINLELANSLNQLAPFGHGNPPIILAS